MIEAEMKSETVKNVSDSLFSHKCPIDNEP